MIPLKRFNEDHSRGGRTGSLGQASAVDRVAGTAQGEAGHQSSGESQNVDKAGNLTLFPFRLGLTRDRALHVVRQVDTLHLDCRRGWDQRARAVE